MINVSKRKSKNTDPDRSTAAKPGIPQRHPALAGGSAALVVIMSMMTINAVWYQPAAHPAPLFATRAVNVDHSKGRPGALAHKISPKLQITASKNLKADDLTREVQTVLADINLYSGSLDGIYGTKTKAAITAYQSKAGIGVSGNVSEKLLSHILMSRKPASHAKVSNNTLTNNSDKHDDKVVVRNDLVSSIQTGLKNYGYDDVVVDGLMGQQTSDAIRRFELDYGLRITGEASQKLLKKLSEIGAVDLG